MIEAGVDVKTRRPNTRGLEVVLYAMHQLHGERHAPELPLPHSAVRDYAARFGFSSTFCRLVTAYDHAILTESAKQMNAENKKMEVMQTKANRASRG